VSIFGTTIEELYGPVVRKAKRENAKRNAKSDLVICPNHGPKALTRRHMKLEPDPAPTLRGRKSRRLRRNRWVPR
jgi:hypothetical protein